MTGTIKHLNTDRGFGFIKSDDGGPDIFFHANVLLNRSLAELRLRHFVTFDINHDVTRGKDRAINLSVVD